MNEREALQPETQVAEAGPVVGGEPAVSVAGVAPARGVDARVVSVLPDARRAAVMRGMQRSAGNAAVHRWIAGAAAPPRSAVARLASADLDEMAEAGQDAATRDMAQGSPPPIFRVSNVADVSSARALVAQIEGYRANMQAGAGADGAFTVSPTRVTPEKMAANESAISQLDDYLVTAGEQSRNLGSFQDAMGNARIDYERLKAQVTHLTVMNRIDGDSTPGDIGNQIVASAGLGDADASQARMRQLQRDPAMLAVHNQTQEAHDRMVALGQQVGQKQSRVSQTAYAYNGALNAFKTGFPSVTTNPDQARELNELKEKIESVKKYVGKGLELAGKAAGAAGVPGADEVGGQAQPAVDWLTDQFYDAQLNAINAKVGQFNAAHAEHRITSDLDAVRAAARAFTGAITDFNDTNEAFAHTQRTFREGLRAFGSAADRGGGDRYAQVASVLAEVDTYANQLDTTLRLGYQEQTAAAEAARALRTAQGGPGAAGAPRDAGLPYYEPYRWFHANGGWSYECQRQEINLHTFGTSRGSAAGVANVGVNATVDEAITLLQGYRREIEPMRHALASAMNLNMDSAMPTASGRLAPTARGANQGL